jgi:hypothetical protein
MQGDLTALIERVEKATGPDRQLDCLLDCIRHDREFIEWTADTGVTGYRYKHPRIVWGSGTWREEIAYTSSLDAALALVEEKLPGCQWTVETDACWLRVLTQDDVDEFQGSYNCRGGTCTALAVVLALLRALQSQQENSEVKDAG